MKKIILGLIILTLSTVVVFATDRQDSPNVRYIYPKNEAIIDLTGKKSITFSWKSMPIPAGGRRAYRFKIFDGFGYEMVVNETLDFQVYSIEIPADTFKNDALYTWQVKQRSKKSGVWGKDNRWSFRIKK